MSTASILIVDDEPLIRWALAERLETKGYRVVGAENGRDALERYREGVDVVVLDYKLPDSDGVKLLPQIKEMDAEPPVIMMTAHNSVDIAVQAMKAGAYDYLNKPFDLDEMVHVVERALETTRLRREVRALRRASSAPYDLDRIIGESAPMVAVKTLLAKIAKSPASTVLLTGESGTGKDLAAKAIHFASDRAERPFVNITCSAMPEQLLESELFGHERGAFTDAKVQKKGLLEEADGGTVFLDEIGETSAILQSKLLRFLEEKAFRRVGGSASIRVNVRVIAATNLVLENAIRNHAFREDLYYRLSVMNVTLPPLRERAGDIKALIQFYVDQFNGEFKKSIRAVTPEAFSVLDSHNWPGNVRELKNAVERAVLLANAEELTADDFRFISLGRGTITPGFRLPPAGIQFVELERSLVVQALERTEWNLTRAAELLGMNRDQIRYRIKLFKLEKHKVS